MKAERVWRLLAGVSVVTLVLSSGAGEFSGVAAAADAEALLKEGINLRRSGDDATALQRFQQAYELSKTPRALTQIGLAEQALGRWVIADKHLREALEAKDDAWIRKNHATIDQALVVVATHIGQLDVSGTPAGAEVRVDGELVGQLPLARPITVNAGGVAVEVRAPGYLAIVRAANVTAGRLAREVFTLQPLAPATDARAVTPPPVTATRTTPGVVTGSDPAGGATATNPGVSTVTDPGGTGGVDSGGAATGSADAATSSPPRSRRRLLALVAGGLAVGSLAFGVIEHVSWQDKVESFGSMSACGATFPNRGGPGCHALYEDGQGARVLAFVGYGLTAAFAATAVVLYLTDPGRGGEPQKLACAPVLMTPGFGCALRF